MSSKLVVEVKDLYKRFPGADALSGLNLSVEQGVILGLLGPNGSGKSSLLKCIAGLFNPTKGEVLVLGEKPSRKTKAKVSFLPEIDHLYSWMTVAQTLDFVGAFYDDWQPEVASTLIKDLNLDARKQVGKLSKGMRARLKLVLSMARKAELILLDEPLSGIDPPSRSRIVKAIAAQHIPGEQTIILSTHEVADTEMLFEKIVLLEQGRAKLQGDADELRQARGCSIQDLLEEEYA